MTASHSSEMIEAQHWTILQSFVKSCFTWLACYKSLPAHPEHLMVMLILYLFSYKSSQSGTFRQSKCSLCTTMVDNNYADNRIVANIPLPTTDGINVIIKDPFCMPNDNRTAVRVIISKVIRILLDLSLIS